MVDWSRLSEVGIVRTLLRFRRRLAISYYVSMDREENRRWPIEGANNGVAATIDENHPLYGI
jgi:hypothetical protein